MRPRYNAGDTIEVSARELGLPLDEPMVSATVIFPVETESCFVRLETGGLCLMPSANLNSPKEAHMDASVVFMGNGEFGLPTLRMLRESYDLKCVVTMPDAPAGRGRKAMPTSVKTCATELGVLCLQPTSLKDEVFLQDLRTLNPDFVVVADFKILPEELLNEEWQCVNLHSSLLPMYRGASPVVSTIRNGDVYAGTTAFVIDKGVDTGRVVCNLGTPVLDGETAGQLTERLAIQGADLMDNALQRLLRCERTIAQDTLGDPFIIQTTYSRKLHKKDFMVPWTQSVLEVDAFIRSCLPKPGAWTTWRTREGKSVTLHIADCHPTDMESRVPGEVVQKDDCLYIGCSDCLLRITWVQRDGGRVMNSGSFLRGIKSEMGGYCVLPMPSPITKMIL